MTKTSHTEICQALSRYLRNEILRKPDYPLENETPLISGGIIDSFSITHISVFMEREFGVQIRDQDLTVENMDTISGMAGLVEKALPQQEPS